MHKNRSILPVPPAIAIVAALVLTLCCPHDVDAQGHEAWVLTSNSLVMIDTANPSAAGTPVAVTGLNAGDTLVGIEFRPINGYLYGLGYNNGAGTVQLYNVSYRTGVAAPIGATGTFVAADGSTPVPITGTAFGIDFNPVADRLRIVNDAGQNFRMNPNTGAFVDGDLGGSPGSVTGLNMDGPISGVSGVDSAAYTNNLVGTPFTTLYTLSAAADSLYIQNPPNGGTATLPAVVTLNGNPVDFTAANGFDIAPDTPFSLEENAPSGGNGHAVLTVGGTTSLYTINLTTGAAALIGPIGMGALPVQGFALHAVRIPGECGPQAVAIVEPNMLQPVSVLACGASGSEAPATISGLVPGETLVAIDFRPQTGQLYGLGVNVAAGSGSATLYRLDPSTSAATIVGLASGVADGSGAPIDLSGAASFEFDFDPTVDRIRVVTHNGLNFRLNPHDGTVVGGVLDTGINGLPGGSTGLVGAAYTNSFAQPLIGGTTTLYTLDSGSDRLFIQNPANGGTQTAGLPVTVNGSPLDFGNVVGFDIVPAVRVTTSNAPAAGVAFALLGQAPVPGFGGSAPALYEIDLATGAARRNNMFWLNQVWTGLAVGDAPRNSTTISLVSSAPEASIGQPVTLTATIAPPVAPGASASPFNATGTVAFTIAGVPIPGCGAQPITGLTATCLTAFAALGPVQITAAYGGDGIHRGSTSTALTQTIVLVVQSTTSLAVTPSSAQVGDHFNLVATVTPAWATGTVTFRRNGDVLTTATVQPTGLALASATLPEGTHEIVASYEGSTTVATSQSAPVTVTVTASGPLTQHFAEGATGFMQTDVGVFNAHATSAANVNVKLLPEAGDPVTIGLALGPLERQSIDLNAVVRSLLVPDQGFSVLVESNQPVAATRQMTWGRPVYGSTLESGIPATSLTWYFAEGATNVMSLYYLVENPNATAANVVLTHLLESGAPVTQTAEVPPFNRRTFYINDVPGLASASLSTVITSDLPIVAERAMYMNTTNRFWEGGAAGRGAPALSASWSFAEGATGFFHTYLLFGNPNSHAATVTVKYQLSTGETLTKTYEVAGQARRTVDVNGEDPQLAAAAVGMTITSTRQIVAERAMWWGGMPWPWTEGSVSIGSTATGTVWAIGEGAEGGPSVESTFVLASNGSANQGTLRFTVAYDDGTREQKEYMLLGNARLTVRIADDFPTAVDKKFSVLVESLTEAVPITVEYARYQSPGAFGDGGGAALATRIH